MTDLAERISVLRGSRTPFVLATVVRTEPPTSARPGDRAVLLADGSIEGFVGGECADSTVRTQAMLCLDRGASTLLRIAPESVGETESAGIVTVGNPCSSGGTVDIFLESVLPPMLVGVYGDAPVARALAGVGAAMGVEVRDIAPDADLPEDMDAVVFASHGRGEEARGLATALRAGIDYVGLIASPRRGRDVLDALDVDDELRAHVHTPAGFDVGARTPGEIAVSVLAEVINTRPRVPRVPVARAGTARDAVDPVCGMAVAVTESTLSGTYGGSLFYFCGAGCRNAFSDDPQRYAGAS